MRSSPSTSWLRLPLRSLQSLETPIVFKQGEEFQKFFDGDAHRLAEGVRRVGKIETK